MASDTQVENPLLHPFLFLYQLLQWIISKTIAPNPPSSGRELHRPKVAIIGAGITGITAAAHCVGHGFDVVIFESGGKDRVGGIWTVGENIPTGKHT
jgi:ribulose 1,5-bisphosphate synthetase/thiazole synthase